MILDQKPKRVFCCLEKPCSAVEIPLGTGEIPLDSPIAWLSPGAEPAQLRPRLWEKMLQHLKPSSLPCTQLTAAASRNTTPHRHHLED